MMVLEVENLIRQSYPALRTRAFRLTQNRDRADDLVQSTFERFLRRPPARIARDKVLPWLYVVMRHLFIDHMRAFESRWQPLRDCEVPLMVPEAPEEEPLWTRVQPEEVAGALLSLSETLRRAYEMHVFLNTSYRDIAKHLGVGVTTVGSRIHRARRRLRQLLLPLATGEGAIRRVGARRPVAARKRARARSHRYRETSAPSATEASPPGGPRCLDMVAGRSAA